MQPPFLWKTAWRWKKHIDNSTEFQSHSNQNWRWWGPTSSSLKQTVVLETILPETTLNKKPNTKLGVYIFVVPVLNIYLLSKKMGAPKKWGTQWFRCFPYAFPKASWMLPTTCEALERRFVGRLQSSCSRFGHLRETAAFPRGWLGGKCSFLHLVNLVSICIYVCHQKYRVCGSVVV